MWARLLWLVGPDWVDLVQLAIQEAAAGMHALLGVPGSSKHGQA